MTRAEFRDHIRNVLQEELHKVAEESDFCVPFMIDGPYPSFINKGQEDEVIERFVISLWLAKREGDKDNYE